uniref:interleukin-9 receptor isoform X6 n=1 Tax=Halichoerus grypus TaxID=9711 RepID=UPI001659819B|nr:interleukin-9 receptor isoform X6 [Halichoerus grypus]
MGGSRHCSLQLYPESGSEALLQTQGRSPPGLEGWGPLRLAMGPSRCIWEGWTLESEALMRELSTWLLICTCFGTWVGLGDSVQGEGGATTRWAASIDVSSGPVSAPWCCRPRRCSCLPTTSPSLSTVTSLGGSRSAWWTHSTCPGGMLDPPSDLRSNVSSDYCVLTWSVSPALEPLTSLLSYELAFKKQEETWEQARHRAHIAGVTWLTLEGAELDPGSSYEARLRVQMATLEDETVEEQCYAGQWSEWSQSVCFPSPQSPARGSLFSPRGQPNSSTLVAVPVFLLLTSLTYLVFKLSPRVKRSFYRNVPSPGAFFQSLYSVHNGDFQTWIGAHRTGLLPSQDCVSSPRGVLEPGVQEVIAWLTYDPVDPWQSVALEEEEEGPGAGLPEAVLLAGHVEQRGQPPAYLPQEDWAPSIPSRPASPQSEGSSGDYWALGCPGDCHPSTFPGNTQSSGPSPALACGLSCDQQNLDTW